jgi:hypothetical protein
METNRRAFKSWQGTNWSNFPNNNQNQYHPKHIWTQGFVDEIKGTIIDMGKMDKVFYMEKGDGRKCRKCMRTVLTRQPNLTTVKFIPMWDLSHKFFISFYFMEAMPAVVCSMSFLSLDPHLTSSCSIFNWDNITPNYFTL